MIPKEWEFIMILKKSEIIHLWLLLGIYHDIEKCLFVLQDRILRCTFS